MFDTALDNAQTALHDAQTFLRDAQRARMKLNHKLL